jgi:hypothetical protein
MLLKCKNKQAYIVSTQWKKNIESLLCPCKKNHFTPL